MALLKHSEGSYLFCRILKLEGMKMGEKPRYDIYIHETNSLFHVTLYQKTKKKLTIGRGSHKDKRKALRLAVENLNYNLKLGEIANERDS